MKIILGKKTNKTIEGAEYCYWDGTAPDCRGACPVGFNETRRDGAGDGATCWTGTKARCCIPQLVGENCLWVGTAPFCADVCAEGYTEMTQDRSGDGSNCWTGKKLLCCKLGSLKSIKTFGLL